MPRELADRPGRDGVRVRRRHHRAATTGSAWGELCGALAAHLVERYGIDEVAAWGFEVWNEANLEVFWTGTRDEYFRLYDVAVARDQGGRRAAAGRRAVDRRGRLDPGLPRSVVARSERRSTSCRRTRTGTCRSTSRESLRVRGLDGVEVWWTEWGVTPTHFYAISDSVFSATFLLHGMKCAQGRADALAYWVVSDHFEELGRPPALLHGGFGLLTVGNLRKPRWWALALAQELGDELLPLTLDGDGAGTLVDGWASRGPDGTIDVLLWNGTLDQTKAGGDPLLDREIVIEGLVGPRDARARRRDALEHRPPLARPRARGRRRPSWPSCARPTGSTSRTSARSTAASRSRCPCRASARLRIASLRAARSPPSSPIAGLVVAIAVPFFWASRIPIFIGAALLVAAGLLSRRALPAVAGIAAAVALLLAPGLHRRLAQRARHRVDGAGRRAAPDRRGRHRRSPWAASDPVLRARDIDSGDERWRLKLDKPSFTETLRVWRTGRTLLAVGYDDCLKAIDLDTGKVRWSAPPAETQFAGVTDGENVALTRCPADQCQVESYSLSDGRLRWKAPVGW